MTKIDYDHALNLHTQDGPREAFKSIFVTELPRSLLDVGCGTGTWLKAALDSGVTDVFGVDGVVVPENSLLVPRTLFSQQDFTRPWNLGRRFDAVLCLEVAEHLDGVHADQLLDTLVAHADTVIFSAACPGQRGQHHVNCEWPNWWQKRFNDRGYSCDDAVRWTIWDNAGIEPWYRQNMFRATRDLQRAGREPRIPSVVHPDFLRDVAWDRVVSDYRSQIESGSLPVSWYLSGPCLALIAKAKRACGLRR
jgi:hypothetical protein